jgi:hypothetical protein
MPGTIIGTAPGPRDTSKTTAGKAGGALATRLMGGTSLRGLTYISGPYRML